METSGSRFLTLSWWPLISAFLVLCFCSEICNAKVDSINSSCTSFCGHVHNISYPFRLNHDPKHCGDPMYTLSCESNITVLALHYYGKYYVQAINYTTQTIRLLDPGLENNNCSSMPRNFPFGTYPVREPYGWNGPTGSIPSILPTPIFYLRCRNPVNSSLYIDAAPCLNNSATSLNQPKSYSYVKVGRMEVGDLNEGCSAEWLTFMSLDYSKKYYNASYEYIHSALMYGFELHVYLPEDIACRLFFPARLLFGVPVVTAFLVYKWRRRHLSMYSTIEDFLQSNNNFLPIRYSYSDIKKMTRKFKDKLGEGAIKVLGKPKANGQDFISEIATIGRIHHVNVVQLIGYCVEGSKRALVYEFMANGSLDKYIYSKEGSVHLSIEKMYDISLGVAQGIEYLHQGCEMQILHFDIKPHNILLDENFKAKVSDFGLAKLYPVDNSIVTLTAARGTMGYIAPELFYKNIGGVSYKADVYSFGMLLMEMASRRKNLNAMVEQSSQIYFPLWVHDQYVVGNDLDMDNVTEEEKKVIRKMIIAALWCIQLKPSDRPTMSKVIEMLRGDVECLQMPVRPSLYPQETPVAVGDIQDKLNPILIYTCNLFRIPSTTRLHLPLCIVNK
ncbi:receptor-like protein kinase [Pyrus ussuriensis x Pyrus communis]|uniref:Receptor-like protein kinase n=1 Tax=Pyrus ussuriensis x Pyrus communis TaxID=2448454 RepID=A0A5N5I6G9_9ROSA|nr:receptor-like protein kinase [Pyrus ussuriensis x Pyrus communis]